MKRLFVFLWGLLLLPMLLSAQVPVEEEILAKISDPQSPYFYPNLMMRYTQGDRSLTEEEYHYLYYGFAYQEDYRPLEPNEAYDKVLLLASSLDVEHPEVATLEQLLIASDEAMRRDPFSPRLLNLRAFAYGALGNREAETRTYEQMRHVMMTIEDSGDGLSKETPCHILMFDHALSLMDSYGVTTQKAKILSREVEYLPLTVPRMVMGKKIRGYYFDYSRIYRNKPEGYTFQRDRTWQFNNLPPRKYK